MLDAIIFVKRLEILLTHYELSSAAFADRIDVQPSSISHLLKGRNKPSLEFVMKINEAFPEVDLHWLLYGKGSFPNNIKEKSPKKIMKEEKDLHPTTSKMKPIERIIVFYVDGTFKNFTER